MKRLFLAIATHEGLETTVSPILRKLKITADQRDLDIRWTHPSHFHVTLVFLGNANEAKIKDIEAAVETIAAETPPFTLKIAGMGAFPDEFTSRVIWFGVQNSKHLRLLQDQLTDQLRVMNFPIENKEYVPHMTIARLRNPNKTKDMTSPFVRKSFAKIPVTEVVLYESVGGPPFPSYKVLKVFQLTGTKVEEETTDSSYQDPL